MSAGRDGARTCVLPTRPRPQAAAHRAGTPGRLHAPSFCTSLGVMHGCAVRKSPLRRRTSVKRTQRVRDGREAVGGAVAPRCSLRGLQASLAGGLDERAHCPAPASPLPAPAANALGPCLPSFHSPKSRFPFKDISEECLTSIQVTCSPWAHLAPACRRHVSVAVRTQTGSGWTPRLALENETRPSRALAGTCLPSAGSGVFPGSDFSAPRAISQTPRPAEEAGGIMSEAGLTGEGAAGTPGTNNLRQNKTNQFERSTHGLVPRRTGLQHLLFLPAPLPGVGRCQETKRKGVVLDKFHTLQGLGWGRGRPGPGIRSGCIQSQGHVRPPSQPHETGDFD